MCKLFSVLHEPRSHANSCVVRIAAFDSSTISVQVSEEFDNKLHSSNSRTGTRGATSAEYFLRAGYAVIFAHRQFSLQPFSRHYSHTTNPFLDLLEIQPETGENSTSITVKPEGREFLLQVLKARQEAQKNGTLHTLTFVTINDYLFLLRALSAEMACLRRNAMYYLAAAVSDFFLPRQKMVRSMRFASVSAIGAERHSASRSTRFSHAKAACTLRWIKYPRCSNQWWKIGLQKDSLSRSK